MHFQSLTLYIQSYDYYVDINIVGIVTKMCVLSSTKIVSETLTQKEKEKKLDATPSEVYHGLAPYGSYLD